MFPPIAQLDATFVASPAVLFLAPIAAAEGRRSRIALGSRRFPLLYTCYSATILDALRSNLMAVLVCLARFILYLPAYRCGARLATISCGAGIVHESRAAVGEPSTESMSCAGRLKRRLIAGGLCFAFLTVAAGPLLAQSAENVALVINDNSPASQRIGDYYARKRGIPASNVFRIRTSPEETIERLVYQATIEAAVAAALSQAGLQDRILYIVLTKGVPLRIKGTEQLNGTVSSVDSELTLLYRRLTGLMPPVPGRIDNPYFAGARAPSSLPPFTHKDFDIYLVTRLDAFSVEDVIGLIDKSLAPSRDGKIVLDQQDKLVNRTGEDWLAAAADRLKAQGAGERVVLETTTKGARDISPVLGYYSWGSNDPRNRVRKYGMGFVPGSLAATFVSSDARTFQEPPATWMPSDDTNRSTWFAGSPQSLIGDLIREGATGVAGHVAEPYLQSTIRPEVVFPAYLSGSNLAEAFYAAMPHLSWQTVVIGDPLCAPFGRKALTRSELEEGVDSATLLPGLFAKRRIAAGLKVWPGASEKAVAQALRGDVLMMRGDRAAARAAYEEATAVSPQIAPAQLQIALSLDGSGQLDAAIERYRRVLMYEPANALALNNLAYRLAVDKKKPSDALPLATQAAKQAPQDPTILDTLAWVQHLLGDDAAAVKTMAAALRGAPANVDIHLHAAAIYAANGARAVAEDQLAAAIKLKPSIEGSAEVKQLRQEIERLAAPK